MFEYNHPDAIRARIAARKDAIRRVSFGSITSTRRAVAQVNAERDRVFANFQKQSDGPLVMGTPRPIK